MNSKNGGKYQNLLKITMQKKRNNAFHYFESNILLSFVSCHTHSKRRISNGKKCVPKSVDFRFAGKTCVWQFELQIARQKFIYHPTSIFGVRKTLSKFPYIINNALSHQFINHDQTGQTQCAQLELMWLYNIVGNVRFHWFHRMHQCACAVRSARSTKILLIALFWHAILLPRH